MSTRFRLKEPGDIVDDESMRIYWNSIFWWALAAVGTCLAVALTALGTG